MNYGYFDNKNREYVIERPDTPAPWVNYLGSPAYGAIISTGLLPGSRWERICPSTKASAAMVLAIRG